MASLESRAPWWRWLLITGLLLWVLVKLLKHMHLGCASSRCAASGFAFGLPLFGGALALAVVGGAFLSLMRSEPRPSEFGPRLFTAVGAGLVLLVVYVFVRSLFNHLVWSQPVSRWEVWGVGAGVVLAALWRQAGSGRAGPSRTTWQALLQDGLWLLLLCVVIADRELPRAVNLSSDPDLHVFFATQIERLGGVPFHQAAWGPLDFNYPAGSGVVMFIWQQLTGLGYLQLMPVLGILFAYLAALVVAETMAPDETRAWRRGVLRVAVLGLTAAAFLFPLYREYFHQEGGARQLAMLPAALFVAVAVAEWRGASWDRMERSVLVGLLLFVLAVLNPAHVVLPLVALAVLWVLALSQRRGGTRLVTAVVLGLGMVLMEPYYQGTLGWLDRGAAEGVAYAERFVVKPWPALLEGIWATWTNEAPTLAREMAILFGETGRPLFLTYLLVYAVVLVIVTRHWRIGRPAWVALLLLLVGVYLAFGLSRSLLDDRRFFLLAPYVFFNMTQFKALLLTALLAVIVLRVGRWPIVGPVLMVVAAAALTVPVMLEVRAGQPMYLAPRKDYCGAFDCPPPEDLRLLRALEERVKVGDFQREDGAVSRVLLPNAPMHTEHEAWVLPVSSARVFPYSDTLPAAFYYFQGEPFYGTASYYARVCERLDRDWLRAQRIDYVFLPSRREPACVAGMEELIRSEEVVLQDGNAYLLRFLWGRQPSKAR